MPWINSVKKAKNIDKKKPKMTDRIHSLARLGLTFLSKSGTIGGSTKIKP